MDSATCTNLATINLAQTNVHKYMVTSIGEVFLYPLYTCKTQKKAVKGPKEQSTSCTSSFVPSFPLHLPSFVSFSSFPLPPRRPLSFFLSSSSYSRAGSLRPPPPHCRCPLSDPSFSSLVPHGLLWVQGEPR